MTERQNLISLLRRQGYNHVPVEFNLCPHLEKVYREKTHSLRNYRSYFKMPWESVGGLIHVPANKNRFDKYHTEENLANRDFSIDSDGVGHKKTATSMHMTQMFCPLANADSLEQIDKYPLSELDEAKSLKALKAAVRLTHLKGLAAVGNIQCTVWETAWYIRGMENLMMDMMCEDPMAEHLLDKVADRSLKRAVAYAKAGVDILFLGDDIGMQNSIMMSEDLYCTWLKPRLKKIISAAKAVNPNLIVFYHSCGFVTPFIPHLIDAGVDVLNPVQPECMNFEEIHEAYGDKISFNGTIGTQSTMPFGTPADVRKEVEKNLKIAGDKGGLFVSPTHLLEPEVPWENILAYVDACRHFCG